MDPDDSVLQPESSPTPSVGPAEAELATQAMERLLQPMARLMIDHGLQLPALVELLKKALVSQAEAAYGLAQKDMTDSRISILTGVHRKDVKRLREAESDQTQAQPMLPLAASVVARWISEPRYLNADHSPAVLSRTANKANAGQPDFASLVAELSRDVGARAVLDELLRLGVVELREDNTVALRDAAFVPRGGVDESFHFLSANVSDHLSTAVHNLNPHRTAPLMLEQSAFSQGLSSDQAEQLHQLARSLWMGSLQQFLQTANVAEQRSLYASGPKHRVRYGVYFYESPQAEDQPSVDALPRPRKGPGRKKS